MLYYYFDCMDGYYARKFGKVTRFGDYYDHFRDWFVAGVMITLLFIKLKSKQDKIVFASITATLLLFCSMYVGCQEVIGEEHGLLIENSSPTLGCTRGMCPNPTKTIKVVRFFGPSTFVIFLCVYIWYSSRHSMWGYLLALLLALNYAIEHVKKTRTPDRHRSLWNHLETQTRRSRCWLPWWQKSDIHRVTQIFQ